MELKHVTLYFLDDYKLLCKVKYEEVPVASTGGPRIARILGPKTIVLLEESC